MSDLTPEIIFQQRIPSSLAENSSVASSIGAVYQFIITGDDGGNWSIDFTKSSDFVASGVNEGADCTVTMSGDDFVALYTGKLAGPQAFMMGKLKIEGDMALAMKLGQVLA